MKLDRWILPIALIALWVVVSSSGLLNPLLVPAPWSVAQVALETKQWEVIGGDLYATCVRLVFGFAIGGGMGIALGIAMGRSVRIYRALEFIVDFFRSIPVAALFPLFIVFFGIGNASKVATTCWSTALIVLVHTMYGVRSCSPVRERFAETLHASRIQILRTIVIPEAMPSILAGLRTGLSIALIVVVMTEMFLGTSSGLGYRIINAALLYNTPELYFYIALTGFLGYGLNRGSVVLEKRVLHWQRVNTEGHA